MVYGIILLLSIALSAGFFALAAHEARRGRRYFETYRARLDREADRIAFIAAHVDFPAFLRDVSREAVERAAHELASLSLIAVRFVERVLTRAVKQLRVRRQLPPSLPENRSSFVETLADFKTSLRSARPAAEQKSSGTMA